MRLAVNILHICSINYKYMAEVKISLARTSGQFHLTNTNAQGNTVETDGSPDIGGTGKGARPMELILMGLGSCSSIDVILILQKQRQDLKDIKIDITATRENVDNHSEYKKIHMVFHLFGDIKPKKAQKAIALSVESYCSVAQLLKHTATITYDFTITPQ